MVVLCSMTAFPTLISTNDLSDSASQVDPSLEVSKHTHLHLQSRGISQIGEMCRCPRLSVLYLYGNKLTKIENLDFCRNLTHLYLQNNRIRRIENLQLVPRLQKLFLSNNCISVLEGLERNLDIEELHIDHQDLQDGDSFNFSPSTITALSHSLTFLDIGGNEISNASALHPLKRLSTLYAGKNDLKDLTELLALVQNLSSLTEADFTGNPAAKVIRYREMVTLANHRIKELDGKEINEASRKFLLRMKDSRSGTSLNSRHTVIPSVSSVSGPQIKNSGTSSKTVSGGQISSKLIPSPQTTSKYILPGLITTLPPRQVVSSKISRNSSFAEQNQTGQNSDARGLESVIGISRTGFGDNPSEIVSPVLNEALAHKHSLGEEMFPPQKWNIL